MAKNLNLKGNINIYLEDNVSWKKPTDEWIKINTDRAHNPNTNDISCGGVAQKLCWRALQGMVRGSASYDCKVAKEVAIEHAISYDSIRILIFKSRASSSPFSFLVPSFVREAINGFVDDDSGSYFGAHIRFFGATLTLYHSVSPSSSAPF
ncbi:uncharacterized protein G2W53_018008 [Senna tora]|uniref:Uncharacterized protein n=1 Tax=Senna tora TaxID=362788 RepID=A0A834TZS0_9FABA|nr:uncharacterized protein G2W53_018008 [Senna tora]